MRGRRLAGLIALAVITALGGLAAARRLGLTGAAPPDAPAHREPGQVAAQPDRPLTDIVRERGWRRIPDLNVLVDKSDLTLAIRSGKQVLKSYPIALGNDDLDDKQRRNDRLTPEGEFYICQRNLVPNSRAWDAVWIRLSYPNAEDADRGLAAGLIDEKQARAIKRATSRKRRPPQDTALGSGIGIHAGGIEPRNWTQGCVALQYADAVELYHHLPMHTSVVIRK